ncbi:protein fem-1 homolog C-like isoform X1 [Lytechinus pictus]|uniref:protein fem-1 homolog C-like isoform X1 n=1 Tax=Lytechinus pictus TaxID=7653 RepID=UPI0030B9BBB0
MASTSSCLETAPDQAGDLSSLILKGKVGEDVLKVYAKDGQIDSPDKEGKTPLMIACLHSLKQTVQSLLVNGADPNSRNGKDGNTPMHYACMVVANSSLDRFYVTSERMVTKLGIIKLLVSHGAETVQDNQDGWSPVCVASLYLLTDVVDFLLSLDTTSLKTKIKAMEILGVSQATWDDTDSVNDAFQTFSKVISIRQKSGLLETPTDTSDLTEMLSGGAVKECLTEDDLFESPIAVKGHAFFLGEKLFPNHIKQKYLFPYFADFGIELMFERNMFDEGLNVLNSALALEWIGELKLGSVAMHLAFESERLEDELRTPFHACADELLGSYESILSKVSIDIMFDHLDFLTTSFGQILLFEVFFCPDMYHLKSLLQAVEKSVKVIHGKILSGKSDKFAEMPSVTFYMMYFLLGAYEDGTDKMPPWLPDHIQYVIFKLLFYDNASYKDSSGFNLLHLVAQCVQAAGDNGYLLDLAKAFVRHGCPIDVVNNEGKTARGILEEVGPDKHEFVSEFLTLVSPPTTVLRLEELAIRTVLRHHISYRDALPLSLCEMIEGSTEECDLERVDDYCRYSKGDLEDENEDDSEDFSDDSKDEDFSDDSKDGDYSEWTSD